MILLSVSVVLTMYLLAVGRRWVAGVLVGGALALTLRAGRARRAPGHRAGRPGGPGVRAGGHRVGFTVVHRVRVRRSPSGYPDPVGDERRSGPRRARPRSTRPRRGRDAAEPRGRWPPLPRQAGLRRVHFVAWRDLDDPEAGGSELHAHRIASLWAAAGIDVTFRTSAVPGAARALRRDGYRVLRQAGRYRVFPGAAWEGLRMGHRPGDALVEIWNGMPFFSPLWYRGPRIVFLHHVHADMWGMVLPPGLARLGDTVERRLAPRFYRRSRIVTLSESSRHEIIEMLGLRADRITVAPPGVDARFTPGGERSPTPLGGGGRAAGPGQALRPADGCAGRGQGGHPALRAVIIGEGYERPALEQLRAELGPRTGSSCPAGSSDDELVSGTAGPGWWPRSSQREGWGMTLTEAAACGTPPWPRPSPGTPTPCSTASPDCWSSGPTTWRARSDRVLSDDVLRSRLSRGALARARWFTWARRLAGPWRLWPRSRRRRR